MRPACDVGRRGERGAVPLPGRTAAGRRAYGPGGGAPGLAGRLAEAGVDLAGSPEGWLPGARRRRRVRHRPTRRGRRRLHAHRRPRRRRAWAGRRWRWSTRCRELLTDGAPHPIGMAGPVEDSTPSGSPPAWPRWPAWRTCWPRSTSCSSAPPPARRPRRGARQRDVRGPLLEGPGPDAAGRLRPGPARSSSCRWGRPATPRGRCPCCASSPRWRPAGARVRDRGRLRRPGRAAPPPERDRAGTSGTPPCCRTRTCSSPTRVSGRRGRRWPTGSRWWRCRSTRAARQRPRPCPHGRRRRPRPDAPADQIRAAAADQLRRSTSPRVTVDPGPAVARLLFATSLLIPDPADGKVVLTPPFYPF